MPNHPQPFSPNLRGQLRGIAFRLPAYLFPNLPAFLFVGNIKNRVRLPLVFSLPLDSLPGIHAGVFCRLPLAQIFHGSPLLARATLLLPSPIKVNYSE